MLLSYISHELRSPITSIAGYLTAISDGTMEGDEEVKEALDIHNIKDVYPEKSSSMIWISSQSWKHISFL